MTESFAPPDACELPLLADETGFRRLGETFDCGHWTWAVQHARQFGGQTQPVWAIVGPTTTQNTATGTTPEA